MLKFPCFTNKPSQLRKHRSPAATYKKFSPKIPLDFFDLPEVPATDNGARLLRESANGRPDLINTAKETLDHRLKPTRYGEENCALCAVATLVAKGATSSSVLSELGLEDENGRALPENEHAFTQYWIEQTGAPTLAPLSEMNISYQLWGIRRFLENKGFKVSVSERLPTKKALNKMNRQNSGTSFLMFLEAPLLSHWTYGEKYGNHLHFIDGQIKPASHSLHTPTFPIDETIQPTDITFLTVELPKTAANRTSTLMKMLKL